MVLSHSAHPRPRVWPTIPLTGVVSNQKSARLIAWTFVCASMMSSSAAAQTKPLDLTQISLADLMNIRVTTASRLPESLTDAPARMQVVTAEEIRRRGYRSLTDVLKDLSDFKIDTGGEQGSPVELTVQGIRGGTRVIVMLDGIRISSPTNDPLPILANYPVHSAQQIEILYGPASALYGADAFSATINIISRTATGLSAETSVGQYGLSNNAVSYGARVGANGSLMIAGQFQRDMQPDLSRFYPDVFRGLQGQRTGTFNTGLGPITPAAGYSTNYETPLFAHSLQAALKLGGLQLSLFQSASRSSTALPFTPDSTIYTADAFDRNTLLVTAGTYTRPVGRAISTSSTLIFSRHELDPESGDRKLDTDLDKSYQYAYGSMAKAEEQLTWKASPRISVTTGGTFERFFAIPEGADLNAPIQSRSVPGTIFGTTIRDEFIRLHYSNTGAYAQVQYAKSPRLHFTLGARGDYNSDFGPTFNPRLGLVSRLNARTTLKLLYGTAYLAPSPYEKYAHDGRFSSSDGGATYTSDFWHLPNPDLGPQRKQTAEVQLQREIGQAILFTTSAFYSRMDHLIVQFDPTPEVTTSGLYLGWPVEVIERPENEGDGTTYGGTVGLRVHRSLGLTRRRVDGRISVSIADGHIRDVLLDQELEQELAAGGMSPLQVRAGIDLDWGRWVLAPRLSVSGVQRLVAIDETTLARRTLPGYTTVDLNIRRLRLVSSRVNAFLTIENAFDRRYLNVNSGAYTDADQLVGAPQNPRRITVGIDFRVGR
jgi:outer membrane cobalamin receptor